jgi:hypothetical protein
VGFEEQGGITPEAAAVGRESMGGVSSEEYERRVMQHMRRGV